MENSIEKNAQNMQQEQNKERGETPHLTTKGALYNPDYIKALNKVKEWQKRNSKLIIDFQTQQ